MQTDQWRTLARFLEINAVGSALVSQVEVTAHDWFDCWFSGRGDGFLGPRAAEGEQSFQRHEVLIEGEMIAGYFQVAGTAHGAERLQAGPGFGADQFAPVCGTCVEAKSGIAVGPLCAEPDAVAVQVEIVAFPAAAQFDTGIGKAPSPGDIRLLADPRYQVLKHRSTFLKPCRPGVWFNCTKFVAQTEHPIMGRYS